MEGAMNRQARLRGVDTPWISYGAVTHAEAARRCADDIGAIHSIIETRDDEKPHVTFPHRVTLKSNLEVHTFRGD